MKPVDPIARLKRLVRECQSIREAGKILGVDHVYLWRLMRGEKPFSDGLLRKLGLCRVIVREIDAAPPHAEEEIE